MSTRAIILAAGCGSRLRQVFEEPKCLLAVGGRMIVERQIECLQAVGVTDVVVVVGYRKHAVMDALGTRVRYREYADFERTNNLHTLWSVRDELEHGFWCLFSDVVFETDVLDQAAQSREEFCMVIDTSRVLKDTMRVRVKNNRLTGIGSHIPVAEGHGNFTGIAHISPNGSVLLLGEMEEMLSAYPHDYYTRAIDSLAAKGKPVSFVDIAGKRWCEVDDEHGLDEARCLFSAE